MEISLNTVLTENNPLLAAYYLINNPLPDTMPERIALLKVLGCKGIFDISYKSLYKTSESFEKNYPLSGVIKLLSSLDGSKPYKEQINQNTAFSEEEKALLNFIAPLED